jgi:two-component system, chemotaxis family, protein-glutamate methylesterase/glutaminase
MLKRNIIVIGASEGGLDALCKLTENLPKDLDAAVFIVMHIGPNSILPALLSRCGNLPGVPAEHGKPYKHGCVYVAPSNWHLRVEDGMTMLSRDPRENGHRPAIDVLFRSAARTHGSQVVGIILTGGLDDGSAGLYAIKKRGGVAIVQDPSEALVPSMPRSALNAVDVDFCVPLAQIAEIVVELTNGAATTNERFRGEEAGTHEEVNLTDSRSEPPGSRIPLSCPECNGPMYQVNEGQIARFECFVGHAFSSDSLSEKHSEALERALWTAMRRLKERTVLYQRLIENHKRNNGEDELLQRLEETISAAEEDIKLLREILDRM